MTIEGGQLSHKDAEDEASLLRRKAGDVNSERRAEALDSGVFPTKIERKVTSEDFDKALLLLDEMQREADAEPELKAQVFKLLRGLHTVAHVVGISITDLLESLSFSPMSPSVHSFIREGRREREEKNSDIDEILTDARAKIIKLKERADEDDMYSRPRIISGEEYLGSSRGDLDRTAQAMSDDELILASKNAEIDSENLSMGPLRSPQDSSLIIERSESFRRELQARKNKVA